MAANMPPLVFFGGACLLPNAWFIMRLPLGFGRCTRRKHARGSKHAPPNICRGGVFAAKCWVYNAFTDRLWTLHTPKTCSWQQTRTPPNIFRGEGVFAARICQLMLSRRCNNNFTHVVNFNFPKSR